MNLKYLLGKMLSSSSQGILLSDLMPTTNSFFRGLNHLYDLRCLLNKDASLTIFDIGANIGQTTISLNYAFPNSQIFAFEPIKSTYDTLIKKTAKIDRFRGFNYALGAHSGQKKVWLSSNSLINTLVSADDTGRDDRCESEISIPSEVVQIDTLDSFCKTHQLGFIDLLKVDVEGYEMEVMKGAKNHLSQNLIKLIYSEVSFIEGDKSHQYFCELHEFLLAYGFRLYGLYEVGRTNLNGNGCISYCNALFVSSHYSFE